MSDNYKLLTRLLVGVLKHQVKRYLGDDVVAVAAQAASEHIGDELLSLLKGQESSRDRAIKLELAIESAAEELSHGQHGMACLVLENVPDAVIESAVEALENLESGDIFGHRLQSAIQNLVAAGSRVEPENSLRLSMQLYQAVLMAVLTIPELQPRAQDLLSQSRMWLLSQQIKKIELMTQLREELLVDSKRTALSATAQEISRADSLIADLVREPETKRSPEVEAGSFLANGAIELLREIGRGYQATVWLGRLVTTGREIAIRFLNDQFNHEPEIVRSFKREADILRELSSSSVSHLVQPATFESGRYFYAVDYQPSASSFDEIIESSGVPVKRKLEILCKVADALDELHQQGFIHGDVKPENVVLGSEGQVFLIDFGAVRRLGTSDSDEPIFFTYAYAPPELTMLFDETMRTSQSGRVEMRTSMEIAPRIDVYALGVILLQALDPGLARTGRMEEFWLVDRLVTTEQFKSVIRRALAREPSQRFRTAHEFRVAVELAIKSSTGDA